MSICPIQLDDNMNLYNRGTLIEVHIADLHFGVIDPYTTYSILKEQFANKISGLNFDILSINGDIFDHKCMSNSDVVMYASLLIDELVSICRSKNATMLIIHGTKSHDADQLKLFYHYLYDRTVDVRIVEYMKFEYIKNARILCIPEEYGKPREYYTKFLFYSGCYDSVFMHGTAVGSVYGAVKEDLSSERYPVFDKQSFGSCRGPIIAGHVHDHGCFFDHLYYCSSPIRTRFGEEAAKGFIVLFHNLDTQQYYMHFEEITSFRYDTINIDDLSSSDPKYIINYLNKKREEGIDNIRLMVKGLSSDNLAILKNYYRNNRNIKIEVKEEINKNNDSLNASEEVLNEYKQFDFLLDPTIPEYDKFVKYINICEGCEFITVDKLIELLS